MTFFFSFSTRGASITGRTVCNPIVPGSLVITCDDGVNPKELTDNGDGTLSGDGAGVVDYSTGIMGFDFLAPTPVSGTPITVSYDPVEGGCAECDKCATNKIRLNISPGTISGQSEMAVGLAWARLIAKIRRDVLPIHVEILSEVFEEFYRLQLRRHYDIDEADTIIVDHEKTKLVFDSTDW